MTHWNKFIDAWKHFCKEEDIGVLSGTRRKRMRQKEQVGEDVHKYQPLRLPGENCHCDESLYYIPDLPPMEKYSTNIKAKM